MTEIHHDFFRLELMPRCSCGRENVFFYCQHGACPYRKSQPLYCNSCFEEDDKHDHRPYRILKVCDTEFDGWKFLFDAFREINTTF